MEHGRRKPNFVQQFCIPIPIPLKLSAANSPLLYYILICNYASTLFLQIIRKICSKKLIPTKNIFFLRTTQIIYTRFTFAFSLVMMNVNGLHQ